ncbi:MAG: HK97 gp10 family phage protein [Emcibacter sp.]|nr:HK97 gp10 family phage protein [Emcibacter sp.]
MNMVQAMADYETRLQKMMENMAAQVESGAQSRVARKLNSPNANSPLAQSIRATKDLGGGMRVFTDRPYARYVEFGTVKQSPRPFLTPAVEEVKVTFRGLI